MAMNPLSKYTKIEELSIKLISNGVIPYKEGVLGNKGIKCGVCARSARDEMTLNTPDMLLNGDAISKIIENCVPNVLNADELYVNDVEQLMIAIKIATKEDSYDINTVCPECDHVGRFERSLSYLLESHDTFTEIPTVDLDNGLSIEFIPFTWKQYSLFAERMFELQQKSKFIESNEEMDDDQRMKMFAEIFEDMAKLNFDMISGTIRKITTPDDEEVTEQEYISEWLGEQSKTTIKVIREKMDEVMELGISHNMEVECSECHHQWEINGLKYDPTHFFAQSFSTQNQKK